LNDSGPINPGMPPVLIVAPGPRSAVSEDHDARVLRPLDARDLFESQSLVCVHASLTARRLGSTAPSRSPRLLDALELFVFVRPASYCAPSAVGLAVALGLPETSDLAEQALNVRDACQRLLAELASTPQPNREEALAVAETLARAGWAWGSRCVAALNSVPVARRLRGSGLEVWSRIPEWEDQGPPGEPGSAPVTPEAARARLVDLLAKAGLDEARPTQSHFAGEVTSAFRPRDREGEPNMVLAEAGTGVGKTMGYLAGASVWAQQNGPSVWVSTYTRALQRQIERESQAIYPDPDLRARKAVVRKGRENYLCLLNFQEMINGAQLGNGDLIGLALTSRWARMSRDGDMNGGDFPAWLPTLFAVAPVAQASPANLVDRRGECMHAGCVHYRSCFIEKTLRSSRRADLVIANHALVLSQAAFDGARSARGQKADVETTTLQRLVFDEGHHLFEAADSAFAAALSGAEAAEMRRWVRGPEGRGRRGRGLETRLMEILGDKQEARDALVEALQAATALPGESWSGRIAPPEGESHPQGPIEGFLAAVLEQLRARSRPSEQGMECAARPALDKVRQAAALAGRAVAGLEAPLLRLSLLLENVLDDEADSLAVGDRARIEGVLRGLDKRARMSLPAWRSMLKSIELEDDGHPDFVDWFDATFMFGRVVDAAYRRHWIDPTEPLYATVISQAHGILVTSATLTDPVADDPFARAEMRSGAARLPGRPKTLKVASPFDYAAHSRAIVITDVAKDDPRQVGAAMRELFLAAGGGGLGLFTAIRRLRAVHEKIAGPLADQGLPLYAQHVDPLDVGALVDIFRAEEDACLLGTDAIRDGVDVPGRSLRLLVFDRVPWPRPDILHKARRERFGGKGYDDALARARIAQAFGRLIRRADDKGVFVMLDAAAPTRLFSALPEGVVPERMELVEALEQIQSFL
jgi:ATP-dependent DNA helicase DinG